MNKPASDTPDTPNALNTSDAVNSRDNADSSFENRLKPEDQAKVDEFISRGVNSVERKPFKPMRMMVMLIVVVTVLSVFSQFLANWAGIY